MQKMVLMQGRMRLVRVLGKKMERIKDEEIECMKIHEPDAPITLACSLQVVGSTIFLL